MQYKKLFLAPLGVALLAVTTAAVAVPFNAFDPRSLAMGGTGVASATKGDASFYNPALLGFKDKNDKYILEFPIVKAGVSDPGNLGQSVQDFNSGDYIAGFRSSLNAYNLSPTAANRTTLLTTTNRLVIGLQSLSDKTIQGDADAAFELALPGKRLATALVFSTRLVGGGVGSVSAEDLGRLNAIVSSLNSPTPPSYVTDPTNQFSSSVSIRFAVIGELGLSLAKQFTFKGQSFVIGVTPKYVRVQTYDYRFTGADLDNAKVSPSEGKATDFSLDMDFGVAKDFGHGWRGGLSVKNMFGESYITARGNVMTLAPQARIGVMRHNNWGDLAVDFDLTQNDPVGYDSKTRYLGVGAEFQLWRIARTRVGFRYNFADSSTSIVSGGVGFSPFGINLDLAIAGNLNEIIAGAQTGFHF